MSRHGNARKHDRIDTPPIEVIFSDGQRMYVDTLLNLSIRGACVECQKPIEKLTHVIIIIPLSSSIKIGATIRWCAKNGMKHKIGLEFDELQPDQKRTLTEFISTSFWNEAY